MLNCPGSYFSFVFVFTIVCFSVILNFLKMLLDFVAKECKCFCIRADCHFYVSPNSGPYKGNRKHLVLWGHMGTYAHTYIVCICTHVHTLQFKTLRCGGSVLMTHSPTTWHHDFNLLRVCVCVWEIMNFPHGGVIVFSEGMLFVSVLTTSSTCYWTAI